MQRRGLSDNESAADKILAIAIVTLIAISLLSVLAYMNLDSGDSNVDTQEDWVDPVIEIENENKSIGTISSFVCVRFFCQTDLVVVDRIGFSIYLMLG